MDEEKVRRTKRTMHVTYSSRWYLFNAFLNTRDTRKISRIYISTQELRYSENSIEK